MNRIRIIGFTIAAIALSLWHGTEMLRADEVVVEAALDSPTCALGDKAILFVGIKGVASPPEPIIPPIQGVDIRPLTPVHPSTQKESAPPVVTYRYALTPQDLGQFTIPEITFTTSAGQKLKTKALTLSCVKGAKQNYVILEIVPNKTDVYVNEAVQITLKLSIYDPARFNPKGYELDAMCLRQISGFVRAEEEDHDDRLKSAGSVTRNGKHYMVYARSRIFFPIEAGDLPTPLASMKCQYLKPYLPGGRSTIPDPFWDDAFGKGRGERDMATLFVQSNEVKVHVRPLPEEGKPDGFTGAVGQFEMRAGISNTETKVGSPIELTAVITGTGNPNAVNAPYFSGSAGFKTYPPESNTKTTRSSNKINVTKTFKMLLSPETTDVKAVPQVLFHYFDPEQTKYITLAQGPFPISVSSGERPAVTASTGESVALPSAPPQVLKEDIRPIITSTEDLGDQTTLLCQQRWFLMSLLAPLVVAAACALIQHRLERLKTDEAFARSRQAMRTARKHLAEAKRSLSNKSSREFYGLLLKATTEYVADKLNISSAAVTGPTLSDLLKERTVKAALVAEATDCLKQCEHGRFSAEETDCDAALLKRVNAVLSKLEKGLR